MTDKWTISSLATMTASWIGDTIGLIESHTAILGIVISATVAIFTIKANRDRSIELRRQNDIAEDRLKFDMQKHEDSKNG